MKLFWTIIRFLFIAILIFSTVVSWIIPTSYDSDTILELTLQTLMAISICYFLIPKKMRNRKDKK